MAKVNINDIALDATTFGGSPVEDFIRFRGYIYGGQNLNDFTEPGMYAIAASSSNLPENIPVSRGYGVLLVIRGFYTAQIYFPMLSAANLNYSVYYRTLDSNGTIGWRRLVDDYYLSVNGINMTMEQLMNISSKGQEVLMQQLKDSEDMINNNVVEHNGGIFWKPDLRDWRLCCLCSEERRAA